MQLYYIYYILLHRLYNNLFYESWLGYQLYVAYCEIYISNLSFLSRLRFMPPTITTQCHDYFSHFKEQPSIFLTLQINSLF